MQRPRTFFSLLLATVLLVPAVGRGAEVLDEVPNDALGFVLVHNLTSVDTKVAQLATLLQRALPLPLAFLKDIAGVSEGLNADGDVILALFPDGGGSARQLRFCVWLPVSDYDAFIKSIGATSIEGIAAATIANEDLLVARRGDWALVVDPDQRDRLVQLVDATPSPPAMAGWKPWINSNDVTVVAFAPGVRELVAWLQSSGDGDNKVGADNQSDDDLFGAADDNGDDAFVAANANRPSSDMLENVKAEFRKWSDAAPGLVQTMQQASAIGCGIRLDGNGNAFAGLRVALSKEFTDELTDGKSSGLADLPGGLNDGGEFVLSGAGHVPTSVLSAMATAYVRRTAGDLRTDERTELEEGALTKMEEEVEQAATGVRSIIVSQPSEDSEAVYTNNFLVLGVDSAKTFVGHANEVMRLWNKANRDAKGEARLVFDVEEKQVGSRTASEYALDVAALEGGAVVPEVRQAMERLFGPGGKLRFWIVAADDHTVLLAMATPEQVTKALATLDSKSKIDWSRGELNETNALLPAQSDWRVFVEPHNYFGWKRRESAAMVGVPVIGGPIVKEFPESPPVGIAGGIREGEVWVDAAALAPTLKSADAYATRTRSRFSIRVRGRVAPPPVPAKPN